ncbi:ATP-binding cassette domain-containing protein [Spiroplasma turonicum]|uniref:ABC transporter ATP-binding protein n=1 Tax=Spiroplasma turonicum TaxID=216946 RepID=A0A0K1P5Q4_9MOLU|nr:ATP-binding cassette domain-containing protein [Spiroplasma turonicum]AKU79638.1 ABC transporter ATP-binding protein [Spiroplasma turonicum]ALX70659.1 hypothetical protein STURO_v1c03910 [Spiroplasma turonicum]
MIKLINVQKKVKNKIILNNINLEVNKNDIIGIVGENGSGKSTLLKTILGLKQATKGEIIYNEKSFSYFPDVNNMITSLIPLDLISHYCYINNIKFKEIKKRYDFLINELNLNSLIKTNMKNLSTGEKKRIYMLIILLIKKSTFFFDEPTDNLDKEYNKIFDSILEDLILKDSTIVVVSHSYDFLEKFINKLIVLNEGKIIYNDKFNKGDNIKNILLNLKNKSIEVNQQSSLVNW